MVLVHTYSICDGPVASSTRMLAFDDMPKCMEDAIDACCKGEVCKEKNPEGLATVEKKAYAPPNVYFDFYLPDARRFDSSRAWMSPSDCRYGDDVPASCFPFNAASLLSLTRSEDGLHDVERASEWLDFEAPVHWATPVRVKLQITTTEQ